MKELPDFTLPPVKELHYFDRKRKYPSPNKLAVTHLYKRLLNPEWTKQAIGSLINETKSRKFKNTGWLLNWYFSNYNDDWYLSLFDSYKGITGEITPDYSILNEANIKKMYDVAPNAKIIFLLRNPIQRAWSHYKFNKFVLDHADLNSKELDIQEIIYFINKDGQEKRSNYIQTLNRYTNFYPKEQILIGFFDSIKKNPENLLADIVDFIGGDSSNISNHCNLMTKNNASPTIEMPGEIEAYLKSRYYPMIKELSMTYGSYFDRWYNTLYSNNNEKKSNEVLKPSIALGKQKKISKS